MAQIELDLHTIHWNRVQGTVGRVMTLNEFLKKHRQQTIVITQHHSNTLSSDTQHHIT